MPVFRPEGLLSCSASLNSLASRCRRGGRCPGSQQEGMSSGCPDGEGLLWPGCLLLAPVAGLDVGHHVPAGESPAGAALLGPRPGGGCGGG